MVFQGLLIPFSFVFRGFHSLLCCCILPNRGMAFSCVGKPVVLSKEVESVLVGAAVLGACASGDFASIQVCTTCWLGLGVGFFSVYVLYASTFGNMCLNSSGKVCTFCTARQEPALLSLHPLFNSTHLISQAAASACTSLQSEDK